MSTANESPPPPPPQPEPQVEAQPQDTPEPAAAPASPSPGAGHADFSKLLKGDAPAGEASGKDQALASLEAQLQQEKDARMEERFVWLVLVIILLDIIWFKDATNPVAPIVVLILELVALLVLARRMQVEDYVQVVANVLTGFGRKGGGG